MQSPEHGRSVLMAKDIHFAYPGQPELFSGLNFQAGSWERVGIVGSSGLGKSTLCKLLAGYLRAQSGFVGIDDIALPRKGACPVQLIWQHPEQAVDPQMRMRETLREGGETSPELLRQLGIREDWLLRRPHELSGGELQRFCIARALAARPRFIVADEISTMLDAITQARIWHVLLDICAAQQIGLVVVSHSPALLQVVTTRVVSF